MNQISDEIFKRTLELTKLIQVPKQFISTFWDVEIDYFVISPITIDSFLVRTGTLTCYKPRIISLENNSGLSDVFQKEELSFLKQISGHLLDKLHVLGYQFSHSQENESMVHASFDDIVNNIKKKNADRLNKIGVIKAPSKIWSFSLLKLFYHVLSNSVQSNITDLEERGHFQSEDEKREAEIDALFLEAAHDKAYIKELGDRLQEYDLFSEYESRFFSIVKKHNCSD